MATAGSESAQATVLLVDDDPQIRRVYQRILEAADVSVHVVESPSAAHEWLDRNPQVNVVISDYVMPDQDGISFLRSVRERRAGSAGLQALLVSAEPTLDSALEAFDLNLYGYLRKPVSSQKLVHAVRQAAEKANAEAQSRTAVFPADSDRRAFMQLSENIRNVSLQLEAVTAELHSLGAVDSAETKIGDLSAQVQPLSRDRQLQLLALIDRLDEVRCQMLPDQIYSDPAWNMLMELVKSRLMGFKVSITSLCLASKAPVTTALRKLDKLIADNLVMRVADASDRRRSYVEISPSCEALVSSVLVSLEGLINRSAPPIDR